MSANNIELVIVLLFLSSLFQIVYSIKKFRFTFNPIAVFVIIFFLHNWSYSFFSIFNDDILWNAPYYVSYKNQTNVLYINFLNLWMYFIGFIFFCKQKPAVKKVKYLGPSKIYFNLYLLFSILFLINGFATNKFSLIYGGNQALNSIDAFNPVNTILSARVIFVIVSIYYDNNKRKKNLFYLLLEIFIAILSGGRKSLVIIVIAIILKSYERYRVTFRKVLTFLVVTFLSLYVSIFLVFFRSLSYTDLDFKEKVIKTNSIISDGGSIFILKAINGANSEGVQNWTYNLIKNDELSHTYGMTYVQSLVNTLVIRIFQGELANYQAAYYFKNKAYSDITNHGYDYSFSSEGILNFGKYSFLIYLFLGFIMRKIFLKRNTNQFYDILYFLIISIMFINFRTDTTSFLRNISFFIFSFYFFRKVGLFKKYTSV